MQPQQVPEASKGRSAMSFAWAHRRIIGRLAALLLVAIIVLQNVEPTRVDLLFWSVPAVPKLVLIIISAGLGAVGHLLFRSWWSSR